MADLSTIQFDLSSETPVYRQLADAIRNDIMDGRLQAGEKLPPTRELAGQLGLNRTTVSAAYAVLEQTGVLQGQVGRGSFVLGPTPNGEIISFASSKPAQGDFPLAEFRRLTKEAVDAENAADILQLGSAYGYAPLRRYLLDEALATEVARPGDGLIVTNGCQQALDLLARLHGAGSKVVLEDPTYHGAVRVFARAGAEILPVPVDHQGIDPDAVEAIAERQRPALVVVTPSFHNPTGATLPLERRRRLVDLSHRYGFTLVENDIYSELRYMGPAFPTLKELDPAGKTVLLRSYSKISFPGLRVGWMVGPRELVGQVAEVKELSDLHSDQLSQAVLLRFAESGELARHLERTLRRGAERLGALLKACSENLPVGTKWTQPEGGMNLWVELPQPLDAERLLTKARQAGVTFTPGRLFAIRRPQAHALRISFGGLGVADIKRGMGILGRVVRAELDLLRPAALSVDNEFEPAEALV